MKSTETIIGDPGTTCLEQVPGGIAREVDDGWIGDGGTQI